MTKEEKQLLLKDLCARLPYGVTCRLSTKDSDVSITEKLGLGGLEHFIFGTMDVLAYLRPMSSMTEEEKKEFESLGWRVDELDNNAPWIVNSYNIFDGADWLLSHHFDYRGLIKKGLAIEAPKGMYKNN